MKLSSLIKNIEGIDIHGSKAIEITGISNHSQRVSPGNLFIAKRGQITDGNLYTPAAVASGAVAIVTDLYDPSLKGITQLVCSNVKEIEALIAARYFDDPCEELLMIGVTGTKGKTTTTYLIRHLFESLGQRTGLIGTVEYIVGDHQYPASHTTPDNLTNQKMLREMVQKQCRNAVMEVSSHALDQERLKTIDFDVGVFTNLSPDHLDYHGTMENYIGAKRKLFKKCRKAVYNGDSKHWKQVLEGCRADLFSYAIEQEADLTAKDITMTSLGSEFTMIHKGNHVRCRSPLVGLYNISNALAAAASLIVSGFPIEAIASSLESFPQVPGRLQRVENDLGRKIYVDYAHSGESLEAVLKGLHEFKTAKIITVFGSGGDRDPARRPSMARAAEKYSDISIVTSDNPRTEDPSKIIDDILGGFSSLDNVIVESDRREAIKRAVDLASNDDLVLIAGKGHEKFQIIMNQMVEFDDRLVASEVCRESLSQV